MRALRAFYRKSDNKVVWYHETIAPKGIRAICPSTIEEDLAEIPATFGGNKSDYGGIEVEEVEIEAFLKSDTNEIIAGKLKVGKPRPAPEPAPPEPAPPEPTEIDLLKKRVKDLEDAQ